MIKLKCQVLGAKDIQNALKKKVRGTGKKFEKALEKGAKLILRESKKLVPVASGALKNSGRIVKTGSYFKTQVAVTYTMRYAIYVHEDLTARHKKGKSAKFLEIPIKRNRQAIMAEIKKATRGK